MWPVNFLVLLRNAILMIHEENCLLVFLILLDGLQQPASLEVLFKNLAAKTVWVLLLFHYKRTEYDKNKFDWFKKKNP